MTPDTKSLALALRCEAIPTHRASMAAYMRDQFEFLGVATPARRAVVKTRYKGWQPNSAIELVDIAREIWDYPEREYQYAAIDLLAMHSNKLDTRHLPFLMELVQSKSWWDTVDALASVIGKVLRYRHDGMDQAIGHENMWVRRVAILHQLGWRDKTNQTLLFSYSLQRAHEKEFFIQKAIGWALRDYARHNPRAVREFTSEERARLSPLSYREANKHAGSDI
ncbi:MAG TPA: DNA alkylation repair protein [Duganella sp.]|nr:DNA alkylation repair protein [Duganella sp.]